MFTSHNNHCFLLLLTLLLLCSSLKGQQRILLRIVGEDGALIEGAELRLRMPLEEYKIMNKPPFSDSLGQIEIVLTRNLDDDNQVSIEFLSKEGYDTIQNELLTLEIERRGTEEAYFFDIVKLSPLDKEDTPIPDPVTCPGIPEKIYLYGVIFDSLGDDIQPVPNVKVSYLTNDPRKPSVTHTDKDGRYYLFIRSSELKGTCKIQLTADSDSDCFKTERLEIVPDSNPGEFINQPIYLQRKQIKIKLIDSRTKTGIPSAYGGFSVLGSTKGIETSWIDSTGRDGFFSQRIPLGQEMKVEIGKDNYCPISSNFQLDCQKNNLIFQLAKPTPTGKAIAQNFLFPSLVLNQNCRKRWGWGFRVIKVLSIAGVGIGQGLHKKYHNQASQSLSQTSIMMFNQKSENWRQVRNKSYVSLLGTFALNTLVSCAIDLPSKGCGRSCKQYKHSL